ncbi:MAG: threonine/serine exporter family protein [Negativicutes bacterium]|nr:threonine/serine exporter family protein [Negativicutes bacterium]
MLIAKITAVLAMGTAVGILYRVPQNLLIYGSFAGLLSWGTFYIATVFGAKPVAACFLGSLSAGCLAEALARLVRKPATIFIIPGFIPLVPGREAYTTMLYLVEGRYAEGMAMAVMTLLIGGAIAFGIFLSTTLFRLTANYNVRGKMPHARSGQNMD